MTALVSLLQLCDTFFPVGAFSHSDGLEHATATGRVTTAEELWQWMSAQLSQPLRHVEGPAVHRAWQAWRTGDSERLLGLDAEVQALRASSGAREASRAMGQRLLGTWSRIRPELAVPAWAGAGPALPVAFGIVAAASAVERRAAVEGYLYTRLAATVSAAMRLMPLGQYEGHRLLARALEAIPECASAIGAQEATPLGAFGPQQELAAMSQQYVHSRLFRS